MQERPQRLNGRTAQRVLRVAYAIQNVGGIDFSQDVGDTVPVKQTLLGLRRRGHNVTCFQLRGRAVVRIEDVSDPTDVREVPLGISDSGPFRRVESATRRLQRALRVPYFAFFDAYRFYEGSYRALADYDLCHEHNGLFCVGAAMACARLDLPYVLTVSADPLLERAYGGRPLRGLHRLVATREASFTYRLARRIICVSEAAKRHLVRAWNVAPDKIVVMPNGVDVALFTPQHDARPVRQEFGLGEGPVISFVGGFQKWHGLEQLVESFVQVLHEVPAARLLLVGDGRHRPVVQRRIAELGVESAVVITGLVPQTRVPALLAAADIAVLPYPQLPQELWFSPLKLYEYMAAGKAIVASRAGQIAEVIHHGRDGYLVDPGNVNDLARALVSLIREPAERKRLGEGARQRAVACHSWVHYIERLEGIYDEVLDARQSLGRR